MYQKIAGWYRECGIIPHTLDVDFAAFIDEYKPVLLEHLRSNKTKFFLNRKFGKVGLFGPLAQCRSQIGSY